MRIRKIISGISALAVAASAFAGLALTAEAATVIVDTITYDDENAATKFTKDSWFATSIENGPGGVNKSKCEFIRCQGSSNGFAHYLPLTAEQAANKIVNFEFDAYFNGRVCNLSLSAGGSRAATTAGRALTFSYNANDGKVKIGNSTTFGNVITVGNAATWLHIVADVDNVNKSTALKVYSMIDDGNYSSATPNYSADVAFSDTTLEAVRGFDFFAPNTVGIYMDNIKISTSDRVVYYSQDYESATEADWTTGTSGRFTPVLLTDTDSEGKVTNKYLSVEQDSRNNNGTTITSAALGVVASDYTMEFDAKLGNANDKNNSGNVASLKIIDNSNTNILEIKGKSTGSEDWIINGMNDAVNLPKSYVWNTSITNEGSYAWYHFKLTKYGTKTYLTITNKSTNADVLERKAITTTSTGSGVSKMQFSTSKYLANFALDNLVIQSVSIENDIPAAYTVSYVVDGTTTTEDVASDNESKAANVPEDPKKDFYMFKGWTKDGNAVYDNTKTYLSKEDIEAAVVTDDITYTAVFEKAAYDVTFTVDDTVQKTVLVSNNGTSSVAASDVYEASKVGYNLVGWYKDNDTSKTYSPAEIAGLTITADTNFTAVFEAKPVSEDILKSVTFTTTPGSTIIPPEGDKEERSYNVAISMAGEYATFTDSDVDSITWSYKGAETDDGYVGWDFTNGSSTGTLSITNGVSTYFCVLTATVTKGSDTVSADYKFMINASGGVDASQVYPAAGYPTDYSSYPDSLVGYSIARGAIGNADVLMAKWALVGSNDTRSLTLQKDNATGYKYLELLKGSTASSSYVAGISIGAPTSQEIFEIDTKMVNGTSYNFGTSTLNNTNTAGWSFSFNGSTLSAGDKTITGMSADTWYKILVSYDPSIPSYYIKVYDITGSTLIGEIADQATNTASPTVFSFRGDGAKIKGLRIYKPTVSAIDISANGATINVPETEGETATLDLTAAMTTAEGLKGTGVVDWSLAEGEVAGVTLSSTSAADARITVEEGAPSGNITVVATYGSVTKEYTVKLISSSSNVAFTSSASSVTIPFEGEADTTTEFKAETRTGTGDPIEGEDSITYTLLDSTKTSAANVTGVSLSADGVLTVTPGAHAATVYVQATNASGLKNTVKVNIHGMSFGFGSGDIAEGYTSVRANTVYTDKQGYGFASSDGLTNGNGYVSGTGAYTMKVAVPNGNYTVTVNTTSASVKSEAVSGAATGVSKSISNGTGTFNVAVCDGVLDLTFAGNTNISGLVITKKAAVTSAAKPAIYSIGDSTTKNSGHYSGYDAATATDHREYASWGNCVTSAMYESAFSSYHNHAQAGRNSASFYNEGRLESVLLNIAPGDYVTINMGINSTSNEPYDTLMEYYYIQGVIQRGGIPVILTHTPDGPVGSAVSYDYVDGQFRCSRSNDSRVKKLVSLAQKYDLDLIDIGNWGNAYFNSLTLDDLDKANTTNKNVAGYKAPETVLELVGSWYTDHNHYTREIGTVYAQYIISQLVAIETGNQTPATYTVTFSAGDKTVATRTVTAGGTVSDIPDVPVKTGYTGAWRDFTSETAINEDMIVIAEYTINSLQSEVDTDTENSSTAISITTEYKDQSAAIPANATVTISGEGAIKGGILTSESGAFTVIKDGSTITNVSTVEFDNEGLIAPGDGAVITTNSKKDNCVDMGYFKTKRINGDTITFKINGKPVSADVSGKFSGETLVGIFIKDIPVEKASGVTVEAE